MKTPPTTRCHIVPVEKRRDGRLRYWCLEHKADATAKYGRPATRCRYADTPPILPSESLTIEPREYSGVAIWGAVPPIYDTTRKPTERGVHVHARRAADGPKEVDATFRSVDLISQGQTRFVISELDAIYYMASSVFGFPVKYIKCSLCGFPHLDKDWFSVHEHRRHLCAGCGRQFRDIEAGIGNPIAKAGEMFSVGSNRMQSAARDLEMRQRDYPGGIQIWGSNPSIVWTAARGEEEGIHIHAFGDDPAQILIDDTFAHVCIDGVTLDAAQVRTYMAQSALPHISGRLVGVRCTHCHSVHFDTGLDAFTPHDCHVCASCGAKVSSGGRLRKTIGSPAVELLTKLTTNAVRMPQHHDVRLIPETL